MAKKSAPPLYELIRSSSAPASRPTERSSSFEQRPEPEPAVGRSHDSDETPGSWLRPGRLVQVPAGYLLVVAAAAILIVAAAFIFGHERGRSAERTIFLDDPEAFTAPNLGSNNAGPMLVRDPLEQPRSGPATPARSSPRTPTSGSGSWGAVESDPRECGFSYFVLAETNQAGAVRLAEFCRARGLETYAVRTNTGRFQVIALPGFQRRDSPEVKALEEQIHRIGDQWKRSERGADDLRGSYPLLRRC